MEAPENIQNGETSPTVTLNPNSSLEMELQSVCRGFTAPKFRLTPNRLLYNQIVSKFLHSNWILGFSFLHLFGRVIIISLSLFLVPILQIFRFIQSLEAPQNVRFALQYIYFFTSLFEFELQFIHHLIVEGTEEIK